MPFLLSYLLIAQFLFDAKKSLVYELWQRG